MTVINKLACSLKRRDEAPNVKLAKEIADRNDKDAIRELVNNLSNKNKNIQNDCIKVLYETGELKPELIFPYVKEFIELLGSKNNRLQWGAMSTIDTIVFENPEIIFSSISGIIEAADKGSVITKDNTVNILIKLSSIKEYEAIAFLLLMDQLQKSPANQLPMYAERSMGIINDKNKTLFIKTLSSRLNGIEKDTKRKRVEKVIKKVS